MIPLPRVVSHCPRALAQALAGTAGPVILDIESTGVDKQARTVSVACLADRQAFVLPVRSLHASAPNLPVSTLTQALAPLLARKDLVLVGHNLAFDLRVLAADGITAACRVRDTLKLLKILDPDRGPSDKQRARVDRRDPPLLLGYGLKDAVRQILGVRLLEFPGQAALLPWTELRRYSVSDLAGTCALYRHLWPRLSRQSRRYYEALVSPLSPLLLDMTLAGIQTDADFLTQEASRLRGLFEAISEQHHAQFGRPLGMSARELRRWLFSELALEPTKPGRTRGWREPALDDEAIEQLLAATTDPRARRSLELLRAYRQLAEALKTLGTLAGHVGRDGRIHALLDDKQTSGRVSCTVPNLQALAKRQSIAGTDVRVRNALVATPGHVLVAFDAAQADIRVLAAMTELCRESTPRLVERLERRRLARSTPILRRLRRLLHRYINPQHRRRRTWNGRVFYPWLPKNLANDFRLPGDFYSRVFQRLFGRPPRDKAERNWFKPIVLAIVNGKGKESLARDLGCDPAQAAAYLQQFDAAYPEVAAYRELLRWQIALAGTSATFLGRPRRSTAHWWMVRKCRVQLLVSYKGRDKLWLDVVPLRPGVRTLTCFVIRIWDANPRSKNRGKVIYHFRRGRISTFPYRFFSPPSPLVFRLPFRAVSWRSIRRVRYRHEEALYYGLDRTVRSLSNHVYQGGTADVVKLMMRRSRRLCRQFGARLLLQVHDELVFEVPLDRWHPFALAVKAVLEKRPILSWRVPIVVETKVGRRFGDLAEIDPGSVDPASFPV
jgi:DNA polymerase I-like protein with 3'-5' exonuclease and polymerase domains